jgi:ribosomal protein L39E
VFCLFAAVLGLSSGIAQAQTTEQSSIPLGTEQENLLAMMRKYADRYVSNLPNFVCIQTTRQLEAGKHSKHWRKGDVLTSKLTFNEGHEDRTLILVNSKEIRSSLRSWRTPLVTEGEFGLLLSRVLAPESEATFTWSRWETLKGKRLAVFDYDVDKQHSTLRLSLGDLAKAVVPYHGSVWADPGTGAVWRITDTATDIPAILETKEISTTIDYGEILIGDTSYLLPVEAVVSLLLEKRRVRNEMVFDDYRKFEARSAITFGPETQSDSGQEKNERDAKDSRTP